MKILSFYRWDVCGGQMGEKVYGRGGGLPGTFWCVPESRDTVKGRDSGFLKSVREKRDPFRDKKDQFPFAHSSIVVRTTVPFSLTMVTLSPDAEVTIAPFGTSVICISFELYVARNWAPDWSEKS